MSINKIQTTSQTLTAFLKIICVMTFIVMAIEIIGIILFIVKPEDWFITEFAHAKLFSPFTNSLEDVTLSISAVIAELITELMSNVIMAAILLIAITIFRDISKNYTPFLTKHVNRLKVISLLILADAILIPPLGMLLTMILAPKVDASMEIAPFQIILAVIFYCLSLIFEYGGMLQQQSDETL